MDESPYEIVQDERGLHVRYKYNAHVLTEEESKRVREYVNGLEGENEALRELVSVMAYCMQYERECDGCRMNGADGIITAPAGCDGLRDRLREFEIEV